MSKINKIKTIIIMLLASVLMFTASAFVSNQSRPQSTIAEGEKVFVMSNEIQARMSTPAGLRFRVYLDDQTKAEIDAADEFGFIIAPAINFENATDDYLVDGAMVDKQVVPVSKDKLTEVPESDANYVEGEQRFFVNAVLYNIKEQNWYLDFAAVAYYKTGDVVTYTTNATLPKANIGDLIEAEFYNAEGNAETRGQLLDAFNYGASEEKTVNSPLVGEYTMPAHAIPVDNSNIAFVLTLPETSYSFKLTEDVVVSNKNITAGDNIISGWDSMLVASFDGVLDGQGYNLVMNKHTNARPTSGIFKTINGTLKNLNVIVRADTWSSGNTEYGSFIYTLNGMIENCVITVHPTRYGNTNWTLQWAMIDNVGESAVIRNSVFDNRADMAEKFIRTSNETAIIENVAVVDKAAWTETTLATVSPVGDITNLYLFNGTTNLIAGAPSHKYDGGAMKATSDVISTKKVLGYEVALQDVTVRAGDGSAVEGVFSDSEAVLNVPVMVSEANEDELYTVVTNGQEFYDALKANKRIQFANDIVVNSNNSSEADKIAGFNDIIGGVDFNFIGTIDGNGYNLTINTGSANRPIRGVLLDGFAGTIKNVNIIVRTDNWGSGNTEYPTFIRNMFGTIENSTITLHPTRFGTTWALNWSVFENTNANAVIKNTVIYDSGDVTAKFVRNQDAGTTVENVAIVNKTTWAEGDVATVSAVGNISGLYLFNSLNDLVAGAPAYKYDGSAIVATTDVIDVKNTFGYDVALVNADVIYVAHNGGAHGADVKETMVVPAIVDQAIAQTIEITLSADTLALNEKSAATQLTATVTKGGDAITPIISWSSSENSVVTVDSNGLVTVVGKGQATITATYYGVTATCEVTVEEYFEEVATAAEFLTAIAGNKSVRLTADITVNNVKASTDANSGFNAVIASTYSKTLDGNGYTLTLNAGTTSRPDGVLFSTLNGTVKNINVIINSSNWGSGNVEYKGALIGTLNGTMENVVTTLYMRKFGTAGHLQFAAINTIGEGAVIKNSVINSNYGMSIAFARNYNANSTIENVAVVWDVAWDSTNTSAIAILGNASGVYFFDSIQDVVAGAPAYVNNGSAMVATTESINFAETFGYELTLVNATTTYIAYNSGNFGMDETVVLTTVDFLTEEDKEGIEVAIDPATLALTEKSEDTTLTATITKNGVPVDNALVTWSSSNNEVVTVSNGVVSVVSSGSATVTVTYYGVSASCEVTVEEYWYEVATGADFVSIVNSEPYAKIRLTADITILNSKIEGGISSVVNYVADTFNGVIDGQGYNITLVFAENGRLAINGGLLFNTLNGTIENTSINISTNYWGDGTKRYPGLIGTLNGTFEGNIVNIFGRRYGTSWNYLWSTFSVTTADSVVKNVVIYDANNDMNHPFAYLPDAGMTVENVAIFKNNYWSESQYNAVGTILSGITNVSNVYLYQNTNQLKSAASYVYDVETKTVIANTGSALNYDKFLGFGLTTANVTINKFSANDAVMVPTEVVIPVFANSTLAQSSFTTVTTAEDLYSALAANSNIKLGADIVVNNKYIQESTMTFDGYVVSTFNGILDGQGYTLTLNYNTTYRANGFLFGTLNGTLKNTNIVIRANCWGPGNRVYSGTLIGTLNGTIENCVVNTNITRFGEAWALVYSPIKTLGAGALVKDTVFNMINVHTYYLAQEVEATATVENVALIAEGAWTEDMMGNIYTTCEINGLYLFDSMDAIASDTAAYEFVDGAFVASENAVDFGVVKTTATVRAGTFADSVYTDVEQVIDVLDFAE